MTCSRKFSSCNICGKRYYNNIVNCKVNLKSETRVQRSNGIDNACKCCLLVRKEFRALLLKISMKSDS